MDRPWRRRGLGLAQGVQSPGDHDLAIGEGRLHALFEQHLARGEEAAVHKHLEENNRLGELQLALLERKVRDFLRENAKAVDKKGS